MQVAYSIQIRRPGFSDNKTLHSLVIFTIFLLQYPAKGAKQKSLVVWKMRAPDKIPLVRREEPSNGSSSVGDRESGHGLIRRASQRREMPPIKALADFSPDANNSV